MGLPVAGARDSRTARQWPKKIVAPVSAGPVPVGLPIVSVRQVWRVASGCCSECWLRTICRRFRRWSYRSQTLARWGLGVRRGGGCGGTRASCQPLWSPERSPRAAQDPRYHVWKEGGWLYPPRRGDRLGRTRGRAGTGSQILRMRPRWDACADEVAPWHAVIANREHQFIDRGDHRTSGETTFGRPVTHLKRESISAPSRNNACLGGRLGAYVADAAGRWGNPSLSEDTSLMHD